LTLGCELALWTRLGRSSRVNSGRGELAMSKRKKRVVRSARKPRSARARKPSAARKSPAARLEGASPSGLMQLAADWYWEQDAQYRLTHMSRGLDDKTGVGLQAYLGHPRWHQPALNLTEADWERHRAQLERRESFRDFEMHRLRADGLSVWLSVSGEPVFDARGRFKGYRGIGRDISRQKRAEQLLRLEHTVSRILAETPSASEALKSAIRAICESE